jgi:hypothetical protein
MFHINFLTSIIKRLLVMLMEIMHGLSYEWSKFEK